MPVAAQAQRIGRSLATKTLWAAGTRLAIILVATSSVAYYVQMRQLRSATLEALEKYVVERARHESAVFSLAQTSHTILAEAILAELERYGEADPVDEFDQRFTRFPDGAVRSREPGFDAAAQAQFFSFPSLVYTPELRRRSLAFYHAVTRYGPAWRLRFVDTFAIAPESFSALFWPSEPRYVFALPPTFDVIKEEFFYSADAAHDPTGRSVSTGLYLDPGTKRPMVSLLTPLRAKDGRFLAVLGHDLTMDDLIQRTINESLSGTYNMIFRSDGRLIAHPTRMKEIEAGTGQSSAEALGDPALTAILQSVRGRGGHFIVEPPGLDAYVAAVEMQGPGWYFVTVYPKALLRATAMRVAASVGAIGALALLIELVVLGRILGRRVGAPLRQLMRTTRAIRDGNLDVSLETHGDDELGALASDFEAMAAAVKKRDAELKRHAEALERLVEERTSELAQRRAQAESASRLAALGEMAAGIAHEINNPLAIIQGSAEALLHAPTSGRDPLAVKTAERIVRTAGRIATVVRGLRNFAREGAHDPTQATAVSRLFDDALDICLMRFREHGVELRRPGEPAGLSVKCRSVQIVQVLLNLLNNAFDAVREVRDPWIALEARAKGELVEIAVVDSGPGVPSELRAKIMQPFFTTKSVGSGTGLGLSISHGIALAHGGDLRLDLAAEHTRFVLELPSSEA